jgi:hypothetical protein
VHDAVRDRGAALVVPDRHHVPARQAPVRQEEAG